MKTAQIKRDIEEALATPKKPGSVRELVERVRADKRTRHGDVLRAIRKAPVAIVMADGRRETLAIVTREMSRPSEGAWRASIYWKDGPVGHITRKTLGTIAKELSDVYAPKSVRVVGDDEVMAWTGTEDFAEGVRKVSEVQRWNEGEKPHHMTKRKKRR